MEGLLQDCGGVLRLAAGSRETLLHCAAALSGCGLFCGVGLPGAAEQKSTLTRPVRWTRRSRLRPTAMAEVLGVVSIRVGEPTRVP
jgi:hypothetical protein